MGTKLSLWIQRTTTGEIDADQSRARQPSLDKALETGGLQQEAAKREKLS
jgi:hypothetical protein